MHHELDISWLVKCSRYGYHCMLLSRYQWCLNYCPILIKTIVVPSIWHCNPSYKRLKLWMTEKQFKNLRNVRFNGLHWWLHCCLHDTHSFFWQFCCIGLYVQDCWENFWELGANKEYKPRWQSDLINGLLIQSVKKAQHIHRPPFIHYMRWINSN